MDGVVYNLAQTTVLLAYKAGAAASGKDDVEAESNRRLAMAIEAALEREDERAREGSGG